MKKNKFNSRKGTKTNNNEMEPASSRESISETSKRTRRVLDDAFKAKVALAAIEETNTLIGKKERDIDFLKKLRKLGLL